MSSASEPSATTILITGAAGGLGSVLTRECLSQGWNVAAGWHRTPLKSAPPALLALPLDVTQPSQIHQAIDQINEHWGGIDILINNAGIRNDQLIGQMPPEAWDEVLEVNLKGAFHCSQAVIRGMLRRRRGHIINVGSHSGKSGQRGQSNYAAAKAGLLGLTQSLAKEAGSRNVQVNAVLPGVLPTGMTDGLPDRVLEDYARANTLGRLNTIEEVASFICFLAGTNNISGQTFHLDSRIGPTW